MAFRHLFFILGSLSLVPVAHAGPEIGIDDNRLTVTGSPGSEDYFTANLSPSLAYNPRANEYLLAWRQGDTERDYLEVFTQRLDSEGKPIGEPVMVSAHGEVDHFSGGFPNVIYDAEHDDFLVTWDGHTAPDFESREIFIRRVAADGTPTGEPLPISDDAVPTSYPVIAYDAVQKRHAVAWVASETLLDKDGEEYSEAEIYTQMLERNANGAIAEIGDERRLSSINGYPNDGTVVWVHASSLDLAYAPARGQFLVVWQGNAEFGIQGQWFTSDGEQRGDDIVLSEDWGHPVKLAAAAGGESLLLAWSERTDNTDVPFSTYSDVVAGLIIDPVTGKTGGKHVFAELLTAEHPDFGARLTDVAWNEAAGEYILAWEGNTTPVEERPIDDNAVVILVKNDVYVTRLDAGGAPIGQAVMVGDTGPEGNVEYSAYEPFVAVNSRADQYQLAWFADDDNGDIVGGKYELFGQQLSFVETNIVLRLSQSSGITDRVTVEVENISTQTAKEVSTTWAVTGNGSEEIEVTPVDPAECSNEPATGNRCMIGDLPPGARVTIELAAESPEGSAFTAQLAVSAETITHESAQGNNSATRTIAAEEESSASLPLLSGDDSNGDGGGGSLSWLVFTLLIPALRRRIFV